MKRVIFSLILSLLFASGLDAQRKRQTSQDQVNVDTLAAYTDSRITVEDTLDGAILINATIITAKIDSTIYADSLLGGTNPYSASDLLGFISDTVQTVNEITEISGAIDSFATKITAAAAALQMTDSLTNYSNTVEVKSLITDTVKAHAQTLDTTLFSFTGFTLPITFRNIGDSVQVKDTTLVYGGASTTDSVVQVLRFENMKGLGGVETVEFYGLFHFPIEPVDVLHSALWYMSNTNSTTKASIACSLTTNVSSTLIASHVAVSDSSTQPDSLHFITTGNSWSIGSGIVLRGIVSVDSSVFVDIARWVIEVTHYDD